MPSTLLLGDEAVASAAIDAGVEAAYGYPGTPSTEILGFLINHANGSESYVAKWCSNEKAAYEQALGACMVGRRAMVTMKHVGLNVAADPFVNSVLLDLKAGLVVVVADDPGMHSSQNEQDSRFYADFARTVCLEPGGQQEAYDMTRDAFDLSERIGRPVVLRLVTRMAHSRSAVVRRPPASPTDGGRPRNPAGWTLVPANSRKRWKHIVESHDAVLHDECAGTYNSIGNGAGDGGDSGDGGQKADYLVVTAGIGRNYFLEYAAELSPPPMHIHIGYHPFDPELLGSVPDDLQRVIVFEDGYPFVERALQRVLPDRVQIQGRETGHVPATGELTPEIVQTALGIAHPQRHMHTLALPGRPPQLCRGCPHADSFAMIRTVVGGDAQRVVTSDIGCYALGGLGDDAIADSIVCMGASIGMAKGAAEAGYPNVVATIGDSTFLHSGIPPLIDAVEADAPMTLIILDNSAVAMTGGQATAVPSERLENIVRGVGVAEDHLVTLKPIHSAAEENARLLEREVAHPGLSVIIARRGCVKYQPRKKRVT